MGEEKRLDSLSRKILNLLQIWFRHGIISEEKKISIGGYFSEVLYQCYWSGLEAFLRRVCTGLSDRHSLATPITRPEWSTQGVPAGTGGKAGACGLGGRVYLGVPARYRATVGLPAPSYLFYLILIEKFMCRICLSSEGWGGRGLFERWKTQWTIFFM